MIPGVNEPQSEVGHLLAQIGAEYEAAYRGLNGFSSGSARHAFIAARMEHIDHLHAQLQGLVGDAAIALIAEELDACPDRAHPSDQSPFEKSTTERHTRDDTPRVEETDASSGFRERDGNFSVE